jgi:eukaryotic-like serine/threonine-protein kinase
VEGTTLQSRYQIIELIGAGGTGKTYRGLDLQTDRSVAIKILSLRGATDWKAIELFEREAKILAQLNHPAIPKYIDFFRVEIDRDETFCIVQQLAPGKSLTSWLEAGHLFTHQEVKQIAKTILEILVYLQSFAPPIVHRDLKPQNILRDDAGNIYLVDFGAVRDSYHQTITGGSTLVGTYGYMAPEQFRGRAVLATDLYGLGATLVNLLTGIDPADLPQQNLRIDFRDRVRLDAHFATWLERMLAPIPEDRWRDARQALQSLSGDKELVTIARPPHPISRLQHDGECLRISIPAVWFGTNVSRKTCLATVLPLILLSLIVWLGTFSSFSFILLCAYALFLPWLKWSIPYLFKIATRLEIALDSQRLTIDSFCGFGTADRVMFVEAIHSIVVDRQSIAMVQRHDLVALESFDFKHPGVLVFGTFLDDDEVIWLANELNEWLQSHRSSGAREQRR